MLTESTCVIDFGRGRDNWHSSDFNIGAKESLGLCYDLTFSILGS